MNLLILGAGGFAEIVATAAISQLRNSPGLGLAGFIVDEEYWNPVQKLLGRRVYNIETMITIGGMNNCGERAFVVSGSVKPWRGRAALRLRDAGFEFAEIIHGDAYVHPSASVGGGSFINAGVVVDAGAKIGEHVVINRGVTVGHNCLLEACATIGPGAHLAGNARIGDWATIGMGACVLENRTVGERAVVGAGSVVTRDVPAGETWWGVPARKVR